MPKQVFIAAVLAPALIWLGALKTGRRMMTGATLTVIPLIQRHGSAVKEGGRKSWYGYKSHTNLDLTVELVTAVSTTDARYLTARYLSLW